jgi:hypothetical protein
VNVAPVARLLSNNSVDEDELVTVCPMPLSLFQVTVWPWVMVRVAGLN